MLSALDSLLTDPRDLREACLTAKLACGGVSKVPPEATFMLEVVLENHHQWVHETHQETVEFLRRIQNKTDICEYP